jgi:phage/plasmid-associated DNA primase
VLGYLVTGSMDARNFFIWYGDGSNGKTVVMNLLKTILKKLYHQTSKGIFIKGSRENTEGASPDKIALIGVRCAVYSEGETSDAIDINESLLKMISGKDAVNARALFRAPLTFYPCCKLTLLTNYKPDLNGDKLIKERTFFKSAFVDNPNPKRSNEFQNDPDFVESLNNEYLSEVFTWIMKGSKEYYKDKKLTPPKTIADMTASVFEQQDSITTFLKNRIEITDNKKDFIRKSDMMDVHYKKYCNDNSLRCHPRSTLYKRLEDLQLVMSQLDGYSVYRNVKLREPLEDVIDHADYDNGVDKVSKSIDITTECVKELNISKNDMIDIKKKINKMPPIIEEKKPTKKNNKKKKLLH